VGESSLEKILSANREGRRHAIFRERKKEKPERGMGPLSQKGGGKNDHAEEWLNFSFSTKRYRGDDTIIFGGRGVEGALRQQGEGNFGEEGKGKPTSSNTLGWEKNQRASFLKNKHFKGGDETISLVYKVEGGEREGEENITAHWQKLWGPLVRKRITAPQKGNRSLPFWQEEGGVNFLEEGRGEVNFIRGKGED